MVAKKGTVPKPAQTEVHPSYNLSVGDEEQISNLLKLQPTLLANHTAYDSPDLNKLRTSYKYLYVTNWLYNYRGYLKLQSDYFDIDIFELELMHFFPPTNHLLNSDETTQRSDSLVNKLKLALISIVQGSKLSSINNFEKIFRLWFGIHTPLGGIDEDEDTQLDVDPNIRFDELSITAKYDILFILIAHISNYLNFRNWLERSNLPMEVLRMNPLMSESSKNVPLVTLKTQKALVTLKTKKTQTDYFLLFDNTRLYERTVLFPAMEIPKKRKLAPEYPDEHFAVEQFDIDPEIKFELVFKNIYEYDEYLKKIAASKSYKSLHTKLAKASIVDSIFSNELRKRRYIVNKRKEQQLVSLLATRKRSSRIEAKEKQRQDELKEQEEQEDYEFKLASEKRLERRRKVKEQMGIMDYGRGLSRDDRLKLRKGLGNVEGSGTPVDAASPVSAINEVDSVNGTTPVTGGDYNVETTESPANVPIPYGDSTVENSVENSIENSVEPQVQNHQL